MVINRRLIKGLWFFYKKLIIPSVCLSGLLAVVYLGSIPVQRTLGISYIFLPTVFHYIIYELTSPEEYYFYYNLGLSKSALWLNTMLLSMAIGLTLITI